MNDHDMILALTDALAWEDVQVSTTGHLVGYPASAQAAARRLATANPEAWRTFAFLHDVPAYLDDLNAMHEAEKVLTEEQRKQYALQWLPCVLCINGRDVRPKSQEFVFTHATARQRAEAFLRTLNLWKE